MRRLSFIVSFLLLSLAVFSQTKQIENLQKQQKALQEEIRSTNRLYLDVKKHTTTILERISLINRQIDSRKKLISAQEAEISALQKEQNRLEGEINRLNKELKVKQESYAKAMKGMLNNKYNRNKLFFILSGKSIGESMRRMQYLKNYSRWQKTQAEEIKKQNAELVVKKDQLAAAKIEKEKAVESLQSEQAKLQDEEKNRQTEMAEAKGQEQQLQKTLQDKQQQANRLNAQIEKLIAEEVARVEREAEAARRAAAAEAERKRKEAEALAARKESEAKRKTTEQPAKTTEPKRTEAAPKTTPEPKIETGAGTASAETFNLSKNFVANKGKLPMPVTGTSSIVGGFGQRKHSEWNVTTNSNGIDIQAQNGANIRSVFDGEVSKVFSFPGSNTCVIVRHGDYYTFYANIFDLFVKVGDKVKTGQSLGRIYTDSDSGVSTMHFQLWQKTTKLNPAPWLGR